MGVWTTWNQRRNSITRLKQNWVPCWASAPVEVLDLKPEKKLDYEIETWTLGRVRIAVDFFLALETREETRLRDWNIDVRVSPPFPECIFWPWNQRRNSITRLKRHVWRLNRTAYVFGGARGLKPEKKLDYEIETLGWICLGIVVKGAFYTWNQRRNSITRLKQKRTFGGTLSAYNSKLETREETRLRDWNIGDLS